MRRQNAQKKFVKVVEETKGAENATESWQYWIRKRGGGGGRNLEEILLKLIIKRGAGGAIEMWSTYNLKYLEALKQKWHMIPFVGKANGRQNNEGNVSIFTITIPATFSPPPLPQSPPMNRGIRKENNHYLP